MGGNWYAGEDAATVNAGYDNTPTHFGFLKKQTRKRSSPENGSKYYIHRCFKVNDEDYRNDHQRKAALASSDLEFDGKIDRPEST
jgi:hypothetical protein